RRTRRGPQDEECSLRKRRPRAQAGQRHAFFKRGGDFPDGPETTAVRSPCVPGRRVNTREPRMLARTRTPPETRVLPPVVPPPGDPRGGSPGLLRPGLHLTAKRVFDVTVALILCVPALPLILLSALLVRLSSRGPIFYSQVRLGMGGRPFRIYKIRSMVVDSEKNGVCWSQPGDPRVTRVGRFLRKT